MDQIVVDLGLSVHERWELHKNHIAPLPGNDGGKRLCVVTGIHGDELEGQYVAFLLNQELQRHPEYLRGTVDIYPAMNPLGINTIQRGVPLFDLDMNRIFPGYMQGGTTQRIAGALFDAVKGYRYGIHFASFYLPGDFVPHVRIMDTGYQTSSLGNLFRLPYAVMRTPKPIDTTTLNYNWQIWESNAFSIYTSETAHIDEESAAQAVSAVLRYLSRVGVVKYTCHSGYLSTVINENDLATVLTPAGGIFRALRVPGQEVEYGDTIGEILDPFSIKPLNKSHSLPVILFLIANTHTTRPIGNPIPARTPACKLSPAI